MKVIRDVAYAAEYGERGRLDVLLSEGAEGRPVVMVIHGGGLQALNKERMEGVAAFLVERGFAVVNTNYRLLPAHPFPAQVEDVLRVCGWVRETEQEELVRQDRSRVALLGASAGAYLAMAVGLMLGREEVAGIVAISGGVRRLKGADEDDPLAAPPVELVSAEAPPLLATHSRNDGLVAREHSVEIVEKLQAAGAEARLYLYDGPGELHGIWRDAEATPVRLFAHIEDVIAEFLAQATGRQAHCPWMATSVMLFQVLAELPWHMMRM
ncbi:MAG: alpha/beta hydrolase [Armatimonadota bacterium]